MARARCGRVACRLCVAPSARALRPRRLSALRRFVGTRAAAASPVVSAPFRWHARFGRVACRLCAASSARALRPRRLSALRRFGSSLSLRVPRASSIARAAPRPVALASGLQGVVRCIVCIAHVAGLQGVVHSVSSPSTHFSCIGSSVESPPQLPRRSFRVAAAICAHGNAGCTVGIMVPAPQLGSGGTSGARDPGRCVLLRRAARQPPARRPAAHAQPSPSRCSSRCRAFSEFYSKSGRGCDDL